MALRSPYGNIRAVRLPALVWLLLATVWGSTWLFIKVGLDAGLPPVTFAGLRFVVASVPLLLWMLVRRKPLPRNAQDWKILIGTGLLTFSVNYVLVFWGEAQITSGLAAILYTTFPLTGGVIAHFILPDEPLTGRRIGGVVLAIGGVALIFYNQIAVRGAMALLGSAAIVTAAIATAYADVLIKQRGTHIDPVTTTAVQMVVGFVPMLALGIPLEGNPLNFPWTPKTVFALCYLALLGSSLTFVLLYWLIQRMAVTRTMLIPLLSTLIAVVLGILVLGEALHWRAVLGGIAVLAGLVIAAGERARPATLVAEAP